MNVCETKVVCRPLLNIIYQNHLLLHFLYVIEVLFPNAVESNMCNKLIPINWAG